MQLGSDFLLHFLTTLHVSEASCFHHQEYDNCIWSLRHELHIGQPRSYVAEPRRNVVVRCVARAGGCIYSRRTPDDGRKRRPKHVE